jgi:hypothetical protein
MRRSISLRSGSDSKHRLWKPASLYRQSGSDESVAKGGSPATSSSSVSTFPQTTHFVEPRMIRAMWPSLSGVGRKSLRLGQGAGMSPEAAVSGSNVCSVSDFGSIASRAAFARLHSRLRFRVHSYRIRW